MRFTARSLATFALLFAAASRAAHADTFTYSFYYSPGDGFTVTSPTLIASSVDFTATASCIVPLFPPIVCTDVHIDPVLGKVSWQGRQTKSQVTTYFDLFFTSPADFLKPGVYDVGGNPFSIIDKPGAVTPEPSSLVLLGTGVLGLMRLVRRRYLGA